MSKQAADPIPNPTELHDWLATKASGSPTVPALVEGACNRAVAAGLDLTAASLEVAALNPLLARITVDWRADTGRAGERFVFHTGLGASLPGLAETDTAADRAIVTPIAFSDGSRHILQWTGAAEAARPLLEDLAARLATPLEVLVQRETLTVVAETYLGRRSAARVAMSTQRAVSGLALPSRRPGISLN